MELLDNIIPTVLAYQKKQANAKKGHYEVVQRSGTGITVVPGTGTAVVPGTGSTGNTEYR